MMLPARPPQRILILLLGSTASPPDVAREFACAVGPFYLFQDWGAEVVIASASEIVFPVPRALPPDAPHAALAERFRMDATTRELFSDCLRPDQVFADDFSAAFCVGLPTLNDALSRDQAVILPLLQALLSEGRPVALLHAPLDEDFQPQSPDLLLRDDSPTADALAVAQALLDRLTR